MKEEIKEFLKKLSADEELQAKFKDIQDPDEAYQLAISVQDGYTKEEFTEAMQAVFASQVRELSNDELNAVAGGKHTTTAVTIGTTLSTASLIVSAVAVNM